MANSEHCGDQRAPLASVGVEAGSAARSRPGEGNALDDPAASRPSTPAQEALLEFLARHRTDDTQAFEALCAARPELEDDLRALLSDARCGEELLDRVVPTPSVAERLSAILGTPVDPQVELDSDHAERPSSHLLRQLAHEGPDSARYEVRGEIARGGMGVILKVWDRDLRRGLAMKVARGGRGGTRYAANKEGRLVARFLEEAQITGQLQHPGIVPVHELGLGADSRAYFTMPYVRGRELREIIDLARAGHEDWDLRRAVGVLVKVCEAVGFAHSKGVLHRDLKPSNVMVGRYGETYVMDWGLARVIGRQDTHDIRLRERKPGEDSDPSDPVRTDLRESPATPDSPVVTRDGDVIGTPAYMPPEQARGRIEDLGPRSDVYSIGAMLYHLLTGRMPYGKSGTKATPQTVLAAVLTGPPKPVREVEPTAPPELAEVCAKAMMRVPAERYASALDLARDLEAWLGSRPVAAYEAGLGYALSLAYRRNRPVFLTVAAALVAALCWGVVYVAQIRAAWTRERELVAEANAARDRIQLLSDSSVAALLVNESTELHPGIVDAHERMEAWLRRADAVLEGFEPLHADPDAGPGDGELASLVGGMEELERTYSEVVQHRDTANTLARRTLAEPREEWTRAAESIASESAYGDLRLEPQLGLVPLRQDPHSELWEFWLPLTGEQPAISGDGELVIAPETAIVLVLIPRGIVRAVSGLGNVPVEPFFLGKYEVTQAQWDRIMGPGFVPAASALVSAPLGPRHPVEAISWFDATEFAGRLGCTLPDEIAWEHACGAGNRSLYWWGYELERGRALENLPDQSAVKLLPFEPLPWHDEFPVHAPVGSFEPNPFGLYDMAGNVAEWCSNVGPIGNPDSPPLERRAFRGGSWYTAVPAGTQFRSQVDLPRAMNMTRGLRLARPVRAAASSPPASWDRPR